MPPRTSQRMFSRIRTIRSCHGLWVSSELVPRPAVHPGRGRVVPGLRRRPYEGGAVAMAWLVLVVSGVLESVWAVALGRSAGFTRLYPSLTFAVALVLSMIGLGYALRSIPVGTGYAVWVGIGAAG